MINNQNINLTNLSSDKRVIPNNLLNINEQADRETMLAERPFQAYEINSSAYTDEKELLSLIFLLSSTTKVIGF